MKRIFALFMYILSLFLLSGCEIHFTDGTRYDVPWWLVLIFYIIPTILFVLLVMYLSTPKQMWFVCPNCHKKFQAKRRQMAFTVGKINGNSGEAVLKCPCCGKRALCVVSYDQDD